MRTLKKYVSTFWVLVCVWRVNWGFREFVVVMFAVVRQLRSFSNPGWMRVTFSTVSSPKYVG